MVSMDTPPLETDSAWTNLQGLSGGPEWVAYFVQAYNEFFMGVEMAVSAHRQQPSAKCQGPSLPPKSIN